MNTVALSPIRDLFNNIAPEYDRFNRLSSLGLDRHWRREVIGLFKNGSTILDVGTGTGDLANELARKNSRVVGIDFCENMINAAKAKYHSLCNVSFEVGSADNLPFEGESFDGVASAFVIRNLHHGGIHLKSMREFYRVLRPGGMMVHLELTRPTNSFMAWGHQVYLKTFVPFIGSLLFRNRWPKNYLKKTIKEFPCPRTLCQQIRWAGFDRVCHYSKSGGIASLFVGTKC